MATLAEQKLIDDEIKYNGRMAANDNIEITGISGVNSAKIKDGTIKLEVETPVLKTPETEITPTNEIQPTPELPPANPLISEEAPPEPDTTTPEQPVKPLPPPPPTPSPQTPPPSTETEKEPSAAKAPTSEAEKQPTPEPPAERDTTPPKTIPDKALGETGPHQTNDKTPDKVPAGNEGSAASNMASDKAKKKSLGGKMKESVTDKVNKIKNAPRNAIKSIKDAPKNIAKAVKNAPGNLAKNISNSLRSDQSRLKQLGKKRRDLESDLRKLENKMDGVKGSRAMQLFRFWLPTLYSTIMGVTMGISNAKDEAKITILETKLITLQTVKVTLEATKITTALSMAIVGTGRIIVAGFAAAVIPGLLLIVVSPFIVLILLIKNFAIIKDRLTAAVDKIEKEVTGIIDQLKEVLKPTKERLKKRKEILTINRLMAATGRSRKEYLEEQKAKENQQNQEQQNQPQKT